MIFALVVSLHLLSVFCFGEEQVRMTLLSPNHFKSEEDGHYQCRLSDPDDDPDEVAVESLRTGWTRETAEENPDPPDVVYTGVDYPYYRVEMINNGSNNSFGVFACRATKAGKKETIISITRMRSDADIVPSNDLFTQTVSIGDRNVQITMVNTREGVSVSSFRWRNNTFLWRRPHFGVDTFSIDEPVQLYHAGIYECHIQGERASARHGLNLLIVRACPRTRWGPPNCEGVCDSCYNGGICDENTGHCVCAPGFQGKHCLMACGGNRYGYSCEKRCTYKKYDNKSKCKKILFCLVHPFGCRCNTGFKGLDCNQVCNENTFGASCLQSCHCMSDECNRYTGECEGTDTSCDPGWTGANCQECENGYYGSICDQECHCSTDKCNKESGLCQSGDCLPQWIDLFPPYSCQTGINYSAYTKVNARVPVPVNCTAVEGSSDALRSLDLVLSRSFENLDETDIYLRDVFTLGNTKTVLFEVENVERTIDLFCQLRKNNERVAVLNVTIDVYDLPELLVAPNFVASTSTTITISWAAWVVKRNKGSPPVVGYNIYRKLSNKSDWKDAFFYRSTNGQDKYYITIRDLNPDTMYDFSIAAVREGTGGEGPRGPALEQQKTVCQADPPEPENIIARIIGEKQELVKISWQLPSEDVNCSSGIAMFTVYYTSSDGEISSVNILDPTALSFSVAHLTPGLSYSFHVTLSTSGGESEESTKVEKFVPVLPSLTNLPSLRSVTCNSVTLVWQMWNNDTDQGTPPIVYYIPYQRTNVSHDWISGGMVTHDDTVKEYQFTFWDLTEDTTYEFCVAVAREGYGGEGYKTRILQQNTALCSDAPLSVYAMAASIGIPAAMFLIVIAAVGIVIMRCRSNLNGSPVPRITVEASYENAGHTGPKSSISLKENDGKPHTYEDKRPGQGNQATNKQRTPPPTVSSYDLFHPYENRNKNQISETTLLDSEENPYEVPEDCTDVAHDC